MRLRRIELIVIAVTLAFLSFLGGYFTGNRGTVSIVPDPLQFVGLQEYSAADSTGSGMDAAAGGTGAVSSAGGATDAAQGTSHGSAASIDDAAGAERTSQGGDNAGGISDGATLSGAATNEATTPASTGPAPVGAPRGGDGRININTASRSELMDLPGVGEVISGRIIDYRNLHGAFASIEDLKKVSGIGNKRFEAIRDLITVG